MILEERGLFGVFVLVGNLPNTEIFRRLAKRFGFDGKEFLETDAELQDHTFDLSKTDHTQNKVSEIDINSSLKMANSDHIWLSELLLEKSAAVTLFNQGLEDEYGYGLPRYETAERDLPFILVTAAYFHRSNSTFGGCRIELEEVEINPKDAADLSIEDGKEVKLSNSKGEVILKAKVTDAVAKGVLSAFIK